MGAGAALQALYNSDKKVLGPTGEGRAPRSPAHGLACPLLVTVGALSINVVAGTLFLRLTGASAAAAASRSPEYK